jgi:predicted component of type VI protein secretion system
MIVCPNCNHQNPDGAVQCEACYTPLPATTHCPNCGATVQADASFCGQCGFHLRAVAPAAAMPSVDPLASFDAIPATSPDIPEQFSANPLVIPDPLILQSGDLGEIAAKADEAKAMGTDPKGLMAEQAMSAPEFADAAEPLVAPLAGEMGALPFEEMAKPLASEALEFHTQLQKQIVRLLHIQTNTSVELPQSLTVIHIGKPNERIPPDLDVSGFPNSEIVSRVHADIRVEGDAYYIEDVGSSNGTYINNLPLAFGNRHRLRPGDRIALGKGDKVTFLFQLS